MKLKQIYLIFLLSLPISAIGQSITLDELIKIQKLPPSSLKYVSNILFPDKLTFVESIEETDEDWGRTVWRLNSNTTITAFFSEGTNNRLLFQTNTYNDSWRIQEQIHSYKMDEFDKEGDIIGKSTTHFVGVNYVIRKIVEDCPYLITIELYKKEDFYKNRNFIDNSLKFEIGDNAPSGIVFFVDGTQKHGYIMTAFDVATYNSTLGAALSASFWIKEQSMLCGWKIPTIEIMKMIYNNLSRTGLVKFDNKFFITTKTNSWDSDLTFNLKTGEAKYINTEQSQAKIYSAILYRTF